MPSTPPKLIGSPPTSRESGWWVVFDVPNDAQGRWCATWTGPTLKLPQAYFEAMDEYQAIESITPSYSTNSAVASLRIVYRAGGILGPENNEVAPPIYSTPSANITVALEAHPYFQSIANKIPEIKKLVASGDIAKIIANYPSASSKERILAARLVAGVQSYEISGCRLSVTRFFATQYAPNLSADFAKNNKVFAWDAIKTGGKSLPSTLTEPKFVNEAGVEKPYEWRQMSVSPTYQRNLQSVVTWEFWGIEKWDKGLYSGGTGDFTL